MGTSLVAFALALVQRRSAAIGGEAELGAQSSMPEPGRPISLGANEDRADAEGLLGVLRGCRPVRQRRHAGTTHVARQALWSFWELPRLPRPLVQNKYPLCYPWSSAARTLYKNNPKAPKGGRGLVLEHVRPRNILIANMIDVSEQLTAGELIGYLNRFLAAAVITRDEDLLLTHAGAAYAPLDVDDPDPWARYRTAGAHPSRLRCPGVATGLPNARERSDTRTL